MYGHALEAIQDKIPMLIETSTDMFSNANALIVEDLSTKVNKRVAQIKVLLEQKSMLEEFLKQ